MTFSNLCIRNYRTYFLSFSSVWIRDSDSSLARVATVPGDRRRHHGTQEAGTTELCWQSQSTPRPLSQQSLESFYHGDWWQGRNYSNQLGLKHDKVVNTEVLIFGGGCWYEATPGTVLRSQIMLYMNKNLHHDLVNIYIIYLLFNRNGTQRRKERTKKDNPSSQFSLKFSTVK